MYSTCVMYILVLTLSLICLRQFCVCTPVSHASLDSLRVHRFRMGAGAAAGGGAGRAAVSARAARPRRADHRLSPRQHAAPRLPPPPVRSAPRQDQRMRSDVTGTCLSGTCCGIMSVAVTWVTSHCDDEYHNTRMTHHLWYRYFI